MTPASNLNLNPPVNPVTRWLRAAYRERFNRVMGARSHTDLSRSAMVFAPHPDDEALGCGGTIICKVAAGATVKVVFMTDGSRSHVGMMAEAELRDIRQQEALAAARTMGLPVEAVTFLGFGDGRLSQQMSLAVARVTTLLRQHAPAEIFVPYGLEPLPDHVVTYQVVMTALRSMSPLPSAEPTVVPIVYAYPIWYWRQWPWTRLTGTSQREMLKLVKNSLTSGLGSALLRDFHHSVYVRPVLAQKQAALAQHASQMQRRAANPAWPTLGDVAAGDFLACFLQDYEIFHCPPL